jgi:hypothetical protein
MISNDYELSRISEATNPVDEEGSVLFTSPDFKSIPL